jgi:flagellar basal-body rod modification protein FlgD
MLPISAQTDPSQTSATSGASNNSSGTLAAATDQLTKEDTFLKLLVAQIQNQDPLNPADSIQFVGQLTQFSQLEQLLGINQGVQHLVNSIAPNSGTTATDGTASQ